MRLAHGVFALMMMLTLAGSSEAEIYRVWIDPAIHSHGWTSQEMKAGIQQGLRRWEGICNIRFDFVEKAYAAQIQIRCDELYQPDGTPHGGYCKGRTIWLNNGRRGGGAWQAFETLDALARVVAHEMGHYLGMKHTTHRDSLMYPSAPTWFSASEIAWARRKFGAPVAALRLDRLPMFSS